MGVPLERFLKECLEEANLEEFFEKGDIRGAGGSCVLNTAVALAESFINAIPYQVFISSMETWGHSSIWL